MDGVSTGQPSIASHDVSCAVVPFRYQGRLWITVVVKARFALVAGGVASYVGASEILAGERRIDANPTSSVEAAGDLAPYLPHCDVTFVGHAYAAGGRPASAATARLGLSRDGRPVLDKAVHVFGDRGPGGPTPFERMPLVYERAFGGPGELNPVGTATPNLVHPADPRRPTGFAPISRLWPSRKRLLGSLDRRALDAPILEIPDALPWEYFQAAPPDQQVEHLQGNEWLILDGLHPGLPRVQTRIPVVRGAARVLARAAGGAPVERPVNMVCDTLAIDGHHQTFALVWRGRVDVPGGEAALSSLVVAAALEGPGREVDWARLWSRAPAARSVDAVPAAPLRESAAVDSTMALGPAQASEAVAKMLAPFAVAAAGDVATKGRLEATPFTPPSTAPFEKTLFDPVATKREREEVGASTMALRPEQQAAVGQRAVAPFAISSAGAPGAGAEIPGAPWSPVAAPSLASLAGEATLAFDGTSLPLPPVPQVAPPVPAPVPMAPPPLMAPMPVTSLPVLSPPALLSPEVAPVVAPMPPEAPAPAPRTARPPAVAPVPRAAPAPPPPAPPPPARPPAPPAPPPPPPGSTEALVAKLRAAGAGTGDMEALARALKPPPPPPEED